MASRSSSESSDSSIGSYLSSSQSSQSQQLVPVAGPSSQLELANISKKTHSNYTENEKVWILMCVERARDNNPSGDNDLTSKTLDLALRFMERRPDRLARRPTHKTITRIVLNYERTSSVKKPKGGRKKQIGREEVEYLLRSTKLSIRQIANQLGVSRYLVETVQKECKLRFYRTVGVQKLSALDCNRRLEFANKWHRIFESSQVDVSDICFSDESLIQVGTHLNRQNVGVRREKGDAGIEDRLRESTQRPDYVHCFILLHSKAGAIGPYFIDDIPFEGTDRSKANNLTSTKYVKLLSEKVIPDLRAALPSDYNFSRLWWQQDGASVHTAAESLRFLRETFGSQIISHKTAQEWPPNSPDLNPCDYWLWGQLKAKVGAFNCDNTHDLKRAIRREVANIHYLEVKKAISDFPIRLEALKQANGCHFEPTFKQFKRQRLNNLPDECEMCNRVHACPCRTCDEICMAYVLSGIRDDEMDVD